MTAKKTTEQFIEEANKVHVGNKYKYPDLYVNDRTNIRIICPVDNHGAFYQTPNNHLRGRGCPKCYAIISTNNLIISNEKRRIKASLIFKEKANKVHNNFYKDGYGEFCYINSDTKGKIICPNHGEFYQSPHDHLKGKGCPICKNSHGEREIYTYLIEHNIEFTPQKEFDDCCGKYYPLKFDFFIPFKNLLIEFDGKQHYYYNKHLHKDISVFNKEQLYDQIKNDYALKNDIKLIRIRYDEPIIDKLKEIFENDISLLQETSCV